jgi:hypothetical protein
MVTERMGRRVSGAVFLSASVPVEGRAGYETANRLLIREAIGAVAEVVLGRKLLVWGGHPAITPMLWAAAEALGVEYAATVQLFQSTFFEDQYPEDNERFQNVTYVPSTGDRENSLLEMRRQMLLSHSFDSAVFIGGMEGIWEEYQMLRNLCPTAKIIALPSAGGVARTVFEELQLPKELRNATDFTRWLYELLGIRTNEPRYSQLVT